MAMVSFERNEYKSESENSIKETIDQLRAQIWRLQGQLDGRQEPVQWVVIHKIQGDSRVFLSEPSWIVPDSYGNHKYRLPYLRGNSPASNEAAYLRARPELAFVVYRYYSDSHQREEIQDALRKYRELPRPAPAKTTVQILTSAVIEALDTFMNSHSTFTQDFPGWDSSTPLDAPFLWWYQYRPLNHMDTMPESMQRQLRPLIGWIDSEYKDLYNFADAELKNGLASNVSIPFLYRPAEVLVAEENQDVHSYVAESWGHFGETSDQKGREEQDEDEEDYNKDKEEAKSRQDSKWSVKAWQYHFNGRFYRQKYILEVKISGREHQRSVPITSLNVYPLRFASEGIRVKLGRRGRAAWKYRRKAFVEYNSHHSTESLESLVGADRCILDVEAYSKLHQHDSRRFWPSSVTPEFAQMLESEAEDFIIPAEVMSCDDPPLEPDLLVLPADVVAYNLRQKEWQTIKIDLVRDISWNKKAFDYLVIDSTVKELLEVMVMSKINGKRSTDIIQGKGNGLIILLHGGAGIGKTLTAECIAELAEKPLYRVTSADIGIKAKEAEKNLKSVLHVGRDCVILIDEAEVFLEARTHADLERNALVSIFMHSLEHHEGILILTTNRHVGTFDEALRSRVQLVIEYEAINMDQSRKIWMSFLDRLRTLEKAEQHADGIKAEPVSNENRKRKREGRLGIDFDDIECYIDNLAERHLNGREIRNAITAARELANFKGEDMSAKHLLHVIDISIKFYR
ncbi:aaa family atpase [Cladorrhinum sp. PSN259]|nr:aaa family atpase [Cladorrhinum sp. PSN259]